MTVLAIAKAEIQQRRQFVALAAICGVASALLRLMPPPPPHADLTWATLPFVAGTMLMGMGVIGIAPGLALGLGSSIFAREVAERRLGFWFSRPVAAWQVFAGKVAASATLVAAALVLALAPNLLTDLATDRDPVVDFVNVLANPWSWLIPVAFVAMFAVLNAMSLAVRSRSRLAALDAVVLGAASAAVLYVGRTLHDNGAMAAVWLLVAGVIVFLAVAPLAAGFAWLTAGRCDTERASRAHTATLAACAVLATLAVFALQRRVLDASPADLGAWPVTVARVSPDGRYAVVGGRTDRGRFSHVPMFLVDLRDGRWERIGTATAVEWSADGASAMFFSGRQELARATLESSGVTLETHPWPGGRGGGPMVHGRSASGRWVAVVQRGDVVLVPTDTWKPATRAPLDGDCSTTFVGETLRIVCATPLRGGTVRVVRTDLDDQQRREVVEFERPGLRCHPDLDETGTRLLLSCGAAVPRESTLELVDPSSGARIALLSQGADARGTFLRDGRVVRTNAYTRELTVWTSAGTEQRRIPLPADGVPWGEAAPGTLVMGQVQGGRPQPTLFVDVDRGTVTPEPDLVPLDGERLFRAKDGSYVLRDPVTGARRTIIPGRS